MRHLRVARTPPPYGLAAGSKPEDLANAVLFCGQPYQAAVPKTQYLEASKLGGPRRLGPAASNKHPVLNPGQDIIRGGFRIIYGSAPICLT